MIETAVPKDEADRYGLSVIDGVEIEEKHQTHQSADGLRKNALAILVIGISTKLRLRKKKRSQPNCEQKSDGNSGCPQPPFSALDPLKVGANELGRLVGFGTAQIFVLTKSQKTPAGRPRVRLASTARMQLISMFKTGRRPRRYLLARSPPFCVRSMARLRPQRSENNEKYLLVVIARRRFACDLCYSGRCVPFWHRRDGILPSNPPTCQ